MDYTDLYNFQTGNGVIVPAVSSVLDGIQTKFKETFGADIDVSAETPVGRLIEGISIAVRSSVGVAAQSANQFNVNEATGIYLDSIAQIYDLKRIPGTNTRIVINCYFSSSSVQEIVIPAGSTIMGGNGGKLFKIDKAIIYDPEANNLIEAGTGRPYVSGTATAIDTGPIISPVGSINSIQTSVPGWVGARTESVAYVGTDIETDEEFRRRILRSRATGFGFKSSLESSLNRLIGVYSACVLENNTGSYSSVRGINIPPHAIYVGVDFIETETIIHDIAEAVSQSKPAGTDMVKEDNPDYGTLIIEPVSYGYGNNFSHDISFYKVKRTPINVTVPFSDGQYTGVDVQSDICNTVSEYMETVGVGGTVDGMIIASLLASNLKIGVGQVLVQKDGSSVPYDIKLDMMGYETPFSTPTYVSLVDENGNKLN